MDELGTSEISMSELLRRSCDDGHVNLPVPEGLSCPLINSLIYSVSECHHLHMQTYLVF